MASLPNLIVESKDVPSLVRLLEDFFTPARLSRKLQEVDRSVQSSSPILRKHWTIPTNLLWLSFSTLRNASNVSAPETDLRTISGVLPAIGFAARLRLLLPSTPQWKQDEFRSRLLSKGSISPTLMEIDAATHVLLRQFSVEWIKPMSDQGVRTPEMIVRWPGGEFEIECKAQSVDTGRKVSRRAFYELCDKVTHRLSRFPDPGTVREIQVVVPDRYEANQRRQNEVRDVIIRLRDGGNDVTSSGVTVHVRRTAESTLSHDAAHRRLMDMAGPFGQGLVEFGKETVLISSRSVKPDRIVKAIEKDLSDAFDQLSRRTPARIMCYLPEVSSFELLKSADSSLSIMTRLFLTAILRPSIASSMSRTPCSRNFVLE